MNDLASRGYAKPQRQKVIQPLNERMQVDLWGETIPFEDLTIALVKLYDGEIEKVFAGIEGGDVDDETAGKIITYRCKKALAEALSAASMDFRVSTANKLVGKKGLIAVADGNIFRVTLQKMELPLAEGADENNAEIEYPKGGNEAGEDKNGVHYIE